MTARKRYSAALSELLHGVSHLPAALDVRVHGLALDSRQVSPGDLFLAVSGARSEATAHVQQALARGAAAVLVEGESANGKAFEDGEAVELYIPDLKQHLGTIADRFFKAPSQDLVVIGVTGTNGKTSVSHYLAQFFSSIGRASGIIGTLGYGLPFAATPRMFALERTTPDVVSVHRYLAALRDEGAEMVMMEVSSHGLDQGRVDGVRFDTAVFTNLSRDHLDYHETMAAYAAAKQQLFRFPGLRHAIINADDNAGEQMQGACAAEVQVLRYGVNSDADVRSLQAKYAEGICATLATPLGEVKLSSGLVGDFNLSNLLAVAAVAIAQQVDLQALQALSGIEAVAGRMQSWQPDHGPRVVIDYAHTPDALENAMTALQGQYDGELFVVFGCGGDRDRGKRSEMGAIAERYAQHVLLCDDNPRSEDPVQITEDILQGMQARGKVSVIHDRAAAIREALRRANARDLVLIAGKGHETYQEQNGFRRDFNDAAVAREVWQQLRLVIGKRVSP